MIAKISWCSFPPQAENFHARLFISLLQWLNPFILNLDKSIQRSRHTCRSETDANDCWDTRKLTRRSKGWADHMNNTVQEESVESKSFKLFAASSFFSQCFLHVLWSISRRQGSKAFSSLCTHSCALSACGWRRDESVNRGRFRRSLSLSEANSIAVITLNLLCHSAAISSNTFISFPIVLTASSSSLIRHRWDFRSHPLVFCSGRDCSLS